MSAKSIARVVFAALTAAALIAGTPATVESGAADEGHMSDGDCIDRCDPLFDICCEKA